MDHSSLTIIVRPTHLNITEEQERTMVVPRYDILKKDSEALVWLEAVHELESAHQGAL
jgi:hypothetical protein